MNTIKLSNTDFHVPAVAAGCMRINCLDEKALSVISRDVLNLELIFLTMLIFTQVANVRNFLDRLFLI